jgi:hypothetical protein
MAGDPGQAGQAKYVMRFFFDYCSGTLLWSANDAARKMYDYPVKLDRLPISSQLQTRGSALITDYDESLNWNDPGGPSPWDEATWAAFDAEALQLLNQLMAELGNEYFIINEHLPNSRQPTGRQKVASSMQLCVCAHLLATPRANFSL